MPTLTRALRHLRHPSRLARNYFPAAAQKALQEAVAQGELRHRGEIRVVIESSLPVGLAWAGTTPRERALTVFKEYEVWNTAEHTGVLLYINLADHAVELLADRGIDACVGPAAWQAICAQLVTGLADSMSVEPVLVAVAAINDQLAHYFPLGDGDHRNELDDRPIVL
jgi:uncharacterized membrane protein